MKIVLTFAVASECVNWRRHSTPTADVHVITTGIGMRASRRALREALAMPADFCIASGLAGSLKSQHSVGSIVVARGVKTETKNTILTSDGGLVDAAVRCGANPVSFFFTSNGIVNSPSERSRLASNADAVDMETFHILDEAGRAGVPAVAVRAISDSLDEPLPLDFNTVVDDRGELRWPSLVTQLLKQPLRLAEFTRFGLASSRAARNLIGFLDRYVKCLAATERLSIVDTIATR